jgi:hypothetical protein
MAASALAKARVELDLNDLDQVPFVGNVLRSLLDISMNIMLTDLKVADPHVVGALWNNAGVPTISGG